MYAFEYPHSRTLKEDYEAAVAANPEWAHTFGSLDAHADKDLCRLSSRRVGEAVDVFMRPSNGHLMKLPVMPFATYCLDHPRTQEYYDLIAEISEVRCIFDRKSKVPRDRSYVILEAVLSDITTFPGITYIALVGWAFNESRAGLPIHMRLRFADEGEYEHHAKSTAQTLSLLVPAVADVEVSLVGGDDDDR